MMKELFDFLQGARDFSLLKNLQTCCGVHSVSSWMVTGASFPWGKAKIA